MKAAQRGFTLVELLIAVALLALLTAMLFGGLRVATRHLGHATGQLDRSAQIALVENFLRAQLANAQPFAAGGTSPPVMDFVGESDHLAFVSVAPPSVAFGGLQVLSLDIAKGNAATGGRMLLSWRPYREASGDAPAGASRPLLDHVAEAAFAYFGSTAPAEPPAWHETWQEMADLPALVRLSVVFSDGETMPELIVALRLSSGVQTRAGRE